MSNPIGANGFSSSISRSSKKSVILVIGFELNNSSLVWAILFFGGFCVILNSLILPRRTYLFANSRGFSFGSLFVTFGPKGPVGPVGLTVVGEPTAIRCSFSDSNILSLFANSLSTSLVMSFTFIFFDFIASSSLRRTSTILFAGRSTISM